MRPFYRLTVNRQIAKLKTSIFAASLVIATLAPMFASPVTTHADASCSPNGVTLSGSSWLNGGGVNVCNNGSSPTDNYGASCFPMTGGPGGGGCSSGNVFAGEEWQCVEMVNRLYLTEGWTRATWYGDGDTLIQKVPSGLTEEGNGHISYLNPGDVITLTDSTYSQPNDDGGHGAIVNSVTTSGVTTTVNIINQNAQQVNSSAYIQSGSFSSGNVTLHMNAWTGYNVQAVVHHPTSGGSGGSVPVATGGPGIGVGNAVYLGTDHLIVNQTMQANEYITSSNIQSVLIMQSDGNLVVYTGPGYVATWSSGTYGNPGAYVQLQSNGDVVVYSATGSLLWHSGQYGSPSELLMQPDGNLVEYGSGIAMWYTATGHVDNTSFIGLDRLNPSATMGPGNFIRSSDGRYIVILQSDNNFVEYGPGWHALWNSHSGASGGSYIVMQTDGNLVEYTPNNTAVWYTATGGYGSSFAIIQSDGNFVVYTTGGTPTWSDGAGGTI